MSRRMRVATKEMGDVEVLVIWAPDSKDGHWEEEWDVLRGTRVGDQFTFMPAEALTEVLQGYSLPFVRALGPPPEGALRKLPEAARQCARRKKCPLVEPACQPYAKKMPWCYEPDGYAGEEERLAVAKAIQLWREGVYILVTEST